MKFHLLLAITATTLAGSALAADPADPAEIKGRKVIECSYLENPPFGVMAWSQSDLVKDPAKMEARFTDYNSDSASGLILDATTERDVTKDAAVAVRRTAFTMAYNDKGWYIYIEGEEPLVSDLLDSLVDPKSPGRKDGYEIFFTPGLHGVPYYQIMTNNYIDKVSFFDWGMSHRHYRSLEGFAKVESLPLDNGVGTFVFIPWEALYDWLPVNGDYWRFSIIRWMSFAKAGGVTWGGKVHDTGNFGLIHFQKPTKTQKAAMERRIARTAWFKYLAASKAATTFWTDPKLGDAAFYEEVLKPEIDRLTAAGEALGDPKTWTGETMQKVGPVLGDWMEFDYNMAELRTAYLVNKRFAEVK